MIYSRKGKRIDSLDLSPTIKQPSREREAGKPFFEKKILKVIERFLITERIEKTTGGSCEALQWFLQDNYSSKDGYYESTEVAIKIKAISGKKEFQAMIPINHVHTGYMCFSKISKKYLHDFV